jgi:uncharacterized protein YdgA (DUF945 family)
MRKLLIGLLVVVIIVILLVPYFMGRAAFDMVQQRVASLNSSAKQMQVKLTQYHVGWFTSNGQLTIKQKMPAELLDQPAFKDFPKTMEMKVKLHLYNGPIAFVSNPLSKQSFYWNEPVGYGTATLVTKMAMDGFSINGFSKPIPFFFKLSHHKLSLTMKFSKITVKNTDGGQVVIAGMLSHMTVDQHKQSKELNESYQQNTHLKITMNKITATKDSVVASVPSMQLMVATKRLEKGVWDNHMSLSVPTVTVTNKGKALASISDIQVKSKKTLDNGMVNGSKKLMVKSINVEGKKFSNLVVSAEANNLNAKPLLAVQKQMNSSNKMNKAQQKALMKAVVQMLTGSTLQLAKFNLDSPLGNINAKGKIDFAKQLTKANTGSAAKSAKELIAKSKGSLVINLPASALQSSMKAMMGPGPVMPKQQGEAAPHVKAKKPNFIAIMLMMGVEKGLLKTEGKELVSDVTLANGKVMVNGKEMVNLLAKPKPVPAKVTNVQLPSSPSTQQSVQQPLPMANSSNSTTTKN